MANQLTLDLVGLIGFEDPLRPAVPAAVAECQAAGIRVVMITGDYPETAQSIARQAGLSSTPILTGPELKRLSDPRLGPGVPTIRKARSSTYRRTTTA